MLGEGHGGKSPLELGAGCQRGCFLYLVFSSSTKRWSCCLNLRVLFGALQKPLQTRRFAPQTVRASIQLPSGYSRVSKRGGIISFKL